ncbi:hypothetical protein LTR36_005054 [Oleoguttula mirabilis]|uniref:Uncharacterized protein n=1 Tax=Oleoguttula mirabilis TaxID=1507867 RepID=A0AAV9JXG3_9PEZI|nr:hypothetical protein LTR36_005054 [Oleoguttula mirabilis]
MVDLSLAHRVKMDKRASTLDEEHATASRGGLLLVLLACISLLNIFFVTIGAVLAAILDYTWTEGQGSRSPARYNDGKPAGHRVQLFFFYCTIPLALSALSVYETLALWRHHDGKPLRPIRMIASAAAGILLWVIQLGLEGSCIWSTAYTDPTRDGYCPFAFSGGYPMSYWSTGLAAAWVVPWIVIAVIVLYIAYLALAIMAVRRTSSSSSNSSHAASQDKARMRSYSYRGVDAPEIQTDRDVPEMSMAEDNDARPPSYYRAGSMDLPPAAAEKEMV